MSRLPATAVDPMVWIMPAAYLKISNVLRSRILSGQYPAGFKLPPEKELAKQFGVSQITIRHALRILQDHWLVERRRRVGTIIRPLWPQKRLPIEMADSAGSIRRLVPGLVRELRVSKRVVPESHIAAALQLPEKRKCLYAESLDLLDSQPLAFNRIYIPVDLAHSVDDEMLRHVDFLDVWLKAEGLAVSRHEGSVLAGAADDVCVTFLGVRPGSPVLLWIDRVLAPDGRPLARISVVYRGDCFRLAWAGGVE